MNSTRAGIGNYRRTKRPNRQRLSSGGVGFDTLHAQQRAREAAASTHARALETVVLEQMIVAGAAQVAAGRLCVLCEGLDRHFAGCPETWKGGTK